MEYEFKIDYTDSENEQGELRDVITRIGWTYYAKQDGEIINQIKAESVMSPPDANNFTSLDDVTFAQMIEWVKTSVDEEQLKARLSQ